MYQQDLRFGSIPTAHVLFSCFYKEENEKVGSPNATKA